jgi:HAD superfamily hydrolase (TIGR01509 family)
MCFSIFPEARSIQARILSSDYRGEGVQAFLDLYAGTGLGGCPSIGSRCVAMRVLEVPDFIRGLIFDCDGTLVDSMPLHMRAWEHTIKANGGCWDPAFFSSQRGMPERDIVLLYNSKFGVQFDPKEIVRVKHDFFHSHASDFQPIPHVVEIVHTYKNILPMAVASGGTRENVLLELEAIRLKNCFSVILTADDKIKPKPSPDLFLEAARRLGIAPELCQVFEDGDLGIEAARDAGMLPTDVRS